MTNCVTKIIFVEFDGRIIQQTVRTLLYLRILFRIIISNTRLDGYYFKEGTFVVSILYNIPVLDSQTPLLQK